MVVSPLIPAAQASLSANLSAQVGKYYLNLSGFVSPFASVVLTSDGIFLRATVADAGGNFYISQVLINAGFSHFCLEAVDFKKIGDSFTCINITPATGSVTKKNIFLPPTLGLSQASAAQGEVVFAFGYTMPYATVTLHLGPGLDKTVLADGTGYYIFRLKNLPPGIYELYSTAVYNKLNSLSPSKKVEFRSLSLWDRIIQFIKDLIARLIVLLTSLSLGILWIIIPIIILILILIFKLWPEKLTSLKEKGLEIIGERKPKEHLHHFWLFKE
jgi:hypothetical protein